MHIDWTLHIEDLLVMASFCLTASAVVWKMHTRLVVVETWIELEGDRAERALAVLETVGKALERVNTCYEVTVDRVGNLEDRVNRHHENMNIHRS